MLRKFLFITTLLAYLPLIADTSQGETLERQMWDFTKNRNWEEIEKHLAPDFQAVQFDGPRTKEQYMNREKSLNINEFTLSNFQVTEGSGLFIVTYNVATTETIEGTRLSSNAVRLSVWQQNNNVWQWVAHAVLIPVPDSSN